MENNETFITKWEYKRVPISSDCKELTEAGKQGWEAVGMTHGYGLVMKRPCGKIRIQEKQKEPQYINRE